MLSWCKDMSIKNILKETCFKEKRFTICHEDFRWSLNNKPRKPQIDIHCEPQEYKSYIREKKDLLLYFLINWKVSACLHWKQRQVYKQPAEPQEHFLLTSCICNNRNYSHWILFPASNYSLSNTQTELRQKNYILITLARCIHILKCNSCVNLFFMAKEDSLKWILDRTRVRLIISSLHQQPHLAGEQQKLQTLKWWWQGVTEPGVEKDVPNLGHTIKTPSRLHSNGTRRQSKCGKSLMPRGKMTPNSSDKGHQKWSPRIFSRGQAVKDRLSIWGSLETFLSETQPGLLLNCSIANTSPKPSFTQPVPRKVKNNQNALQEFKRARIPNSEAVYKVSRLTYFFP